VFIDAIVVKVRDGQVVNRPIYVAIGVTCSGERDILGLWAGDGGEGAKFWLAVLTEIKNRGVEDVCITVCDGLRGLPEAITTTWPAAIVQACIIHLIRNTFRYASRRDWDALSKDLRPAYTAPTEPAAVSRFEEFTERWAAQYPAIITLWRNAWSEFIPFLDYGACRRIAWCTSWKGGVRYRVRWSAGRAGPVLVLVSACLVDLHEVERRGGQMQLAGRAVQTAA